MALDPDDLRALRAAYQTLGVPHDATALAIRHAYRRLAKQWHPDKWPAGSEAQDEAGGRMREINDAYRLALHAPLRYHVESHPRVEARAERRGRPAPRPTITLNDTGEYVARFVLGALVGGLVSLALLWTQMTGSVALLVAIPPATGLLSVLFGDAFWGFLLELLWWWA
jgi:hypothetical protein